LDWHRTLLYAFHCGDEILAPRSPPRNGLQRLRKGDVHRMDAIGGKNEDSTSKRCGHRRHKDRVAAVRMLFNDECGYQRMLDLGQRGLPRLVLTFPNESLRETSK